MSSNRILALIALYGTGLLVGLAQDDLGSLLKAGDDFAQNRDWIKAADAYTKATAAYPSQSAGFERLADLYRSNGLFARAAENYRKALAMSPDDQRLRALLQSTEQAASEQAAGVVRAETYRDLSAAVRNVKPTTVPAAGAETIPVHVNFPRSKYQIGDLSEAGRRQLDEVAAVLISPEWRERRPLVVEGHTCSCGSDASNVILGRKRAEAVLEYLVAKNAVRQEDVSAVSMGRSQPVVASEHENLSADACARDEAHNQNRRVIIREAGTAAAPLVTFWYRPLGSPNPRPLTDGTVLYRNDQIQVKVQSPSPLFAYVVHHGPDNLWEVLYPRVSGRDAAMLPAEAGEDGRWIPGPESGFTVSGKPGEEEALVYLSPSRISEFEARPKARPVAPPVPPSPDQHTPATPKGTPDDQPQKPVTGIDQVVRGLAPSAIKLAGPPRAAQPAAKVKFKSRD